MVLLPLNESTGVVLVTVFADNVVNCPLDGVVAPMEALSIVPPEMTGVVSVGDVPKTKVPLPFSSTTAAARLAEVGVAKNVATPVPKPVMLVTGIVAPARLTVNVWAVLSIAPIVTHCLEEELSYTHRLRGFVPVCKPN